MVLQLHIDAPGLVPSQLRASFGRGHWEGREIFFCRIPYLGGVSLAALRFGASFGPDRDKRCGRCLSGRLAWWGVFMANDDKGTRVPALRDLCIVASFHHKRQAGGTKEKAGGRPIGVSPQSQLWRRYAAGRLLSRLLSASARLGRSDRGRGVDSMVALHPRSPRFEAWTPLGGPQVGLHSWGVGKLFPGDRAPVGH